MTVPVPRSVALTKIRNVFWEPDPVDDDLFGITSEGNEMAPKPTLSILRVHFPSQLLKGRPCGFLASMTQDVDKDIAVPNEHEPLLLLKILGGCGLADSNGAAETNDCS